MNQASPKLLKPHKVAFFLPSLLIIGLLASLFTILPGLLVEDAPLGFLAGIWLVIMAISYWLISVKYKKTSYTLDNDKIIYTTGTIISDREIELPIKNITHVQLQLPFISYLLFKTGDIRVESAGTNTTEGQLFAIANSREIYEEIQSLMKKNGFALQKTVLEEELKPAPLAVLLETLKFMGTGLFLVFYIGLSIWGEDENNEISEIVVDENIIMILSFAAGGVLLIIIIFAILRFLDLRKRSYKVYNDTVEYEEGFLTKNYSLIPFENLTDSLSSQTMIDRLFGLYDVALSCQGAAREIKFKNIINGEALSKEVSELIKAFKNTQKTKVISAKKSKNLARISSFASFDTSYEAVFTMDKLRALFFPLLGFIGAIVISTFADGFGGLVFVTVGILVTRAITILSTKYAIETENVDYHYKFIRTQNISFVNEKITSVVLRESWIDKIFGTCQIHFGSIGSATKIKFMHLKKTPELYENILAKFGFINEKIEHEIVPNFTFMNWVKSAIFVPIILLLPFLIVLAFPFPAERMTVFQIIAGIVLAIFVLIFLPIFIYNTFYYKRSRVFFHANYMSVTKGLLVQTEAYSAYGNIKNINSVKYPLTSAGLISFDVAGENVTNQNLTPEGKAVKSVTLGSRSTQKIFTSHVLALGFIDEIPLQNQLLDHILQKPLTATQIDQRAKNLAENPIIPLTKVAPSLKNYLVVPIIITLLFLAPFIVAASFSNDFQATDYLIPIIIISSIIVAIFGLIVWIIKAISFEIQDFRVIKKSGIIYKKQTSILYTKIDHINKSQGFLNKIFANGNVAIHTIGSSKLEMAIDNVDQFRDVYTTIKENI